MGFIAFQYDRPTPSVINTVPSARRLLDAVLKIGAGLDLQPLLRRIVGAAVELVDARCGALGVLDESGDSHAECVTVGVNNDTDAMLGDLPEAPSMAAFLEIPITVHGETYANLCLTAKTTCDGFTHGDEELALGLAAASGVAIENAHLYEQTCFRESAMAAMKEVTTAVLAGTELRASLELVARQARDLLTADSVTIAIDGSNDQGLGVAISDGPSGDALRSERIDSTDPPGREMRSTGGRLAIENGCSDQPCAGRVERTLGVSLTVEGQPLGTLILARAAPAAPFSPVELEVAQTFASQVSLVLGYERLRQRRQQVMLLEDQERIGRDLHDTVIRRLFATGLALQGAALLIVDHDAQLRIGNAVEELDRTIAHIRTVVFDVDESGVDESDASAQARCFISSPSSAVRSVGTR